MRAPIDIATPVRLSQLEIRGAYHQPWRWRYHDQRFWRHDQCWRPAGLRSRGPDRGRARDPAEATIALTRGTGAARRGWRPASLTFHRFVAGIQPLARMHSL